MAPKSNRTESETPAVSSSDSSAPAGEEIVVDLRNPLNAAILGWIWPGAGHLYQRRYAKGFLFMVCVLSTFYFGLAIGGGHVVYASWTESDKRWQYAFQLGVGLPALPAIVQNMRVMNGQPPLFGEIMSPPREQPVQPDREDQLARWHRKLSFRFEMGTLYTMIAGLLNVLAVYDAFAGPALPEPDEKSDKPPPDEDDGKSKED